MWSTADLTRCKVYKDKTCRSCIGRLAQAVFSPDLQYLVGFYVKRPDLVWMFKRSELFFARDALVRREDKVYPAFSEGAMGKKAIERLALDWDKCVILQGMDVVTEQGDSCGFVDFINFDPQDGKIVSLGLNMGLSSRIILGTSEIDVHQLIAYNEGRLVVKEVTELSASGGMAQKAGHLAAKTSYQAQKLTTKSKAVLSQLEGETSVKIGKHLKGTQGMFAAFKEEFDKASKD